MTRSVDKNSDFHKMLASHKPLLLELLHTVLLAGEKVQPTMESIFRELSRTYSQHRYLRYEKVWILKVAYQKILSSERSDFSKSRPMKGSFLSLPTKEKLKNFRIFFERLSISDRFLLCLKDKEDLSFEEISTAMGSPTGTLKVQYSHALGSLDKWIWE